MDECAEEVTMLQFVAFIVQFAKGPDLPTDDYLWFRMSEEMSAVKGECVSPRDCKKQWTKACQHYQVFTKVFNTALPKMEEADSYGLVRRNCSTYACVTDIPQLKAVQKPTAESAGFISWNDRDVVDLIDAVLLAGVGESLVEPEANVFDNGRLWVNVAGLLTSKLRVIVSPKSAWRRWNLIKECYLSFTEHPAATSKFIQLMKEAEDYGAMAFKTIPLRQRPKRKLNRQTEDCHISERSRNTATIPPPQKNLDFTGVCGNGNHIDVDLRTPSTTVANSSEGVSTTTKAAAASSDAGAVEWTLSSKIDKLTDALTELVAVQRQQLEESRRHGQNMERLLARLIGVEQDKTVSLESVVCKVTVPSGGNV